MIRRIGGGSYGEVWLARSVVGTYRAVKVVRRKSFEEEGPFAREFAGLKHFEPISRKHEGVISILHIGMNKRSRFFYSIMELADDASSAKAITPRTYKPRTLAAELGRRRRLPVDECIEIGVSLVEALQHLHQHKLVHCDIKPSNIIFVNGTAKLADIGLVKEMTEVPTSAGTMGYVPPEGPGRATGDLYSLGKVLYEISTGNRPERFPELVEARDSEQFRLFNEIVIRACEAKAEERFQSAHELLLALLECQTSGLARFADHANASFEEDAERKLLSVIVVQIVRTERADPEAAQSFMGECRDKIKPHLQRFGATRVHALGDGVMAVFGGAVACGDHGRRAAHAALAIRHSLEGYREQWKRTYPFDFKMRIGFGSGLAISSTVACEKPPTGDVVDLTAKIVNMAQPGQIVMTEETSRATREYFLIKDLGTRRLHEDGASLRVYELTAARNARSGFERDRELTPFVGRAKELALLRERLDEAEMGRGQIVLLAGEPGLGKSRLLLEFQKSLPPDKVCWLSGRSNSFGTQIAYLPVIDLMKGLFGLEDEEGQANVSGRFEARAEALGEEVRPGLLFLRHLLSLDSKSDKLPDMDGQQLRIKTFEALRNAILKRAQQVPMILAIEDLHWIDRTSQEFFVSLADSLSMAPILMVLTYRPGYQNPFPERSFITRMTLQQLSQRETVNMAGRVLTSGQVPDRLRRLVLEKAEGNPFFVEEMIKSLMEKGALEPRDDRSRPARILPELEVPDAIQGVIMSRIDRLDTVPRKALQLASVIGREFTIELLDSLSDWKGQLAAALEKLKNAELIYERSVFPQYSYFFKHALTQEVAYQSLLLQRRKELHRLVAATIAELHKDRLPEFYGLLAWHYQRGEEWELALDFLCRAALRCRGIAAYREEASQLDEAMAIAERLKRKPLVQQLRAERGIASVKCGLWAQARPDLETALAEVPPENLDRRAELLSSLAGACFWGLDVPGMQKYAAQGEVLAQGAPGNGLSDELVAGLLAWQAASHQVHGDLVRATQLFDRALAKGCGFCSAAHANYPLTLYWQGRIADALQRARESAETFNNLSDAFAATFGHAHLGLTLAACGHYAAAARVFEEASQLGLKHEIWTFRARALAMSAGFHLDLFDFKGNEKLAEEAREQARTAGFRPSEVSAALDLVFNFARRGEVGRARVLATETAALAAQIGGWHQWLWELRLQQARAEIACAAADWKNALTEADAAVAQSRARGRAKYQIIGLETRARALAGLGRKTEAIKDLQQAVQSARAMGDPAVFLRAATTLLGMAGENSLLEETRTTVRRIRGELDPEMRRQFESAEAVRMVGAI